jgi:hypothetical protein
MNNHEHFGKYRLILFLRGWRVLYISWFRTIKGIKFFRMVTYYIVLSPDDSQSATFRHRADITIRLCLTGSIYIA